MIKARLQTGPARPLHGRLAAGADQVFDIMFSKKNIRLTHPVSPLARTVKGVFFQTLARGNESQNLKVRRLFLRGC